MTQKVEEGLMWEEIEKGKAKKRQATSTGGKEPQLRDNVPQDEEGRSRDIIAEKADIGSGRTYERATYGIRKNYNFIHIN